MAIAIPVAMAAIGAAGAASGAAKQNKALKQGAKNAEQAYTSSEAAGKIAAQDQTTKLARAAARFAAASNASATLRGVSGSASAAAVERSVLMTALGDASNVEQNRQFDSNSNAIRTQSAIHQYESNMQNLALSAIQGGLQGLGAGLALSNAMNNLNTQNAVSNVQSPISDATTTRPVATGSFDPVPTVPSFGGSPGTAFA